MPSRRAMRRGTWRTGHWQDSGAEAVPPRAKPDHHWAASAHAMEGQRPYVSPSHRSPGLVGTHGVAGAARSEWRVTGDFRPGRDSSGSQQGRQLFGESAGPPTLRDLRKARSCSRAASRYAFSIESQKTSSFESFASSLRHSHLSLRNVFAHYLLQQTILIVHSLQPCNKGVNGFPQTSLRLRASTIH
jgi:hypothetical protein